MSASVESWWGSVFVFARVFLIGFLFVGGGFLWMFVGGVCKVFGVSVCVFLLIRHDREVATHSSCSAKSSHFVRDTGIGVEGWHDLLTSTWCQPSFRQHGSSSHEG